MDGSKFHKQLLERVTQGTFLWNYFKNWPVVSEKIFLRISSCLHSSSSPNSPEPCLFTNQNSRTCLRKVTQWTFLWNYFKIWIAVSEKKIFLRISLCQNSASSSNSPEPCLLTDQNFANNFWKGSPKEHPCEFYFKILPVVSENKIS